MKFPDCCDIFFSLIRSGSSHLKKALWSLYVLSIRLSNISFLPTVIPDKNIVVLQAFSSLFKVCFAVYRFRTSTFLPDRFFCKHSDDTFYPLRNDVSIFNIYRKFSFSLQLVRVTETFDAWSEYGLSC